MTLKDITIFLATFLSILLGTWIFRPVTNDGVIFAALWASLWIIVSAIRETRGTGR